MHGDVWTAVKRSYYVINPSVGSVDISVLYTAGDVYIVNSVLC